jgi:hypothetical protein
MNYNNRQNRNTFQSKKVVKEDTEFSLKSVLFPEINGPISSLSVVAVNKINYKNALLEPVPEDYKPFVRIKDQSEYELEIKKQIAYHNSAMNTINIMNDTWLTYRLNYIAMYGEDEYERWHISLQDWDKAINGEESESDDESENDKADGEED